MKQKEKAFDLYLNPILDNKNKVSRLKDEALNYTSYQYCNYSNFINSPEILKAVTSCDSKRIKNFKKRFDLVKFKKRLKLYKKCVEYWNQKFDERFTELIVELRRFINIPNDEAKDFCWDLSGIGIAEIGNYWIFYLYTRFVESTWRDNPFFQAYFDRFYFEYDIDLNKIKKQIDFEIQNIFSFGDLLVGFLKGENLEIKDINKLNERLRITQEVNQDIINRNRTYRIELFIKAKEIYLEKKGKKPRITHAEALILANDKLHFYENEKLRDSNGFDTMFFSYMQTSFRRQIKNLF